MCPIYCYSHGAGKERSRTYQVFNECLMHQSINQPMNEQMNELPQGVCHFQEWRCGKSLLSEAQDTQIPWVALSLRANYRALPMGLQRSMYMRRSSPTGSPLPLGLLFPPWIPHRKPCLSGKGGERSICTLLLSCERNPIALSPWELQHLQGEKHCFKTNTLNPGAAPTRALEKLCLWPFPRKQTEKSDLQSHITSFPKLI